jgi:hypothetical protein
MSNKTDWQELFYELLERVEYVGDTYDAVVLTRQFGAKANELEMK